MLALKAQGEISWPSGTTPSVYVSEDRLKATALTLMALPSL